jgi:hypothetical protein
MNRARLSPRSEYKKMPNKIFRTVLVTLAVVALATPVAASTEAELGFDQMFEVTKELYEGLDQIPKSSSADRIMGNVLANGTVILSGQVAEAKISESAETLAKDIGGVKTVVNRIKVATPGD